MRRSLDAALPESLVELGVEADVGGAHRLLREVDDGLDGVGSALLEGAAVDALVEVDGVLAGHDVLERGARLATLLFGRAGVGRRAQRDNEWCMGGETGGTRGRAMRLCLACKARTMRTFLVVFAEGA